MIAESERAHAVPLAVLPTQLSCEAAKSFGGTARRWTMRACTWSLLVKDLTSDVIALSGPPELAVADYPGLHGPPN